MANLDQVSRTCRDSDACIVDGDTSCCISSRVTNFRYPSTGRKKSVPDSFIGAPDRMKLRTGLSQL